MYYILKEHHQEQTKSQRSQSGLRGNKGNQEGSLCVLGSWTLWLRLADLKEHPPDASAVSVASVTTSNSIVPHDFLVSNPQMGTQWKQLGIQA